MSELTEEQMATSQQTAQMKAYLEGLRARIAAEEEELHHKASGRVGSVAEGRVGSVSEGRPGGVAEERVGSVGEGRPGDVGEDQKQTKKLLELDRIWKEKHSYKRRDVVKERHEGQQQARRGRDGDGDTDGGPASRATAGSEQTRGQRLKIASEVGLSSA